MDFKFKFDTIGFFSNMIAVILGIAITFTIQEWIDSAHEKANVDAALELVKNELTNCVKDLREGVDYLDKNQQCAAILMENKGHLKQFPKDSLVFLATATMQEFLMTMPDDALELLKTSSLFQKIGDNELSLKILRAYDQCDALVKVFNRHEEQKGDLIRKAINEENYNLIYSEEGALSLETLLSVREGTYAFRWMTTIGGFVLEEGINDIQLAIDGIDVYLSSK